jgi:putative Mg2+ transporter-C (MgtC) family protein
MDFDWNQILFNLSQLGIALVLALPMGFDREYHSRGAGLRTFPLVAVASCAYMLVGISIFQGDDAVARVTYGVITGMGFIGGGAILKTKGTISGTATAASLWNMGALGISVAHGLYEIAILLSLMNFIILRFVKSLKRHPSVDDDVDHIGEDDG